jgi:PAS domain S-box-containing protein
MLGSLPISNGLWLSSVLRSIGDGAIVCDEAGAVVSMNQAAETLTGWSQSDAIGQRLATVFHLVDELTRADIESPIFALEHNGSGGSMRDRTLLVRRDRTEIPVEESATPIRPDAGELAGHVVIFRDVTDRRRAERNLQLLSDSGRALAEPLDLHTMLENVARLCIRSFSDFCYFDLLKPDGSIDRAVRFHRDVSHQPVLEAASIVPIRRNAYHPVNQALTSGKPTLIEHVTDEWLQQVALDPEHLRLIRELAFHTLLSVPVREGERSFGTLTFCRTVNPAAFHEEDVDFALEMGRRVAVALVNADLYRSMREAQEQTLVEREKLRRLFLEAPAAILMMSGPEHVITLANDTYVRLIRRKSVDDLVGRRLRDAVPELEGQGFFELLDTVYRSGAAYYGREMLASIENTLSGEVDEAYFNFVYQPTKDPSGAVDGILVFAVEITEQVKTRKQAEAREQLLQRQRSELETIYKTAPIGLALFDPVEFRYLRLNDTQAEIVGLPAADILGKTLTEIAPIEGLNEMFEQVAKGEPLRNALLQGELPAQPGVERYWTVNYFPVYGEDGEVQAITAASLEITAQKRAERALIQNEKIAAVGRLASSIAHEINNPLEAVTNLLYLARESNDLQAIHSHLDMADRELRRISLIASQTLRFYRQSTRPQQIQCEALVESVLTLNQGRLMNSGITVETGPWVKRPFVCFEGEIRQVLNNLVGNAVDAMPHGGRLVIRSREGTDWKTGKPGIRLTFADTGMGIPRHRLKQIFEPFFTTKGINGTGLGLWISQEIVEKHQGRLQVRSSQRTGYTGTVFSMYLPFDAVLPDSIQLPAAARPLQE